jgi:hypothetical protein
MPSLKDIVPAGARVRVGQTEIEVFGLTGRAISHLLGRFPDIAKAITGQSIDVSALIRMGPEVVGAIIACGLRKIGDKETEQDAQDLTPGDWIELLAPIVKQTMTKGVAPFASVLADLGLKAPALPASASVDLGTAQDSRSPN